MMAGKPFLELEVDDHTGEAGIVALRGVSREFAGATLGRRGRSDWR